MSNVFTLDSLREEAEKEFAPVKVVLSDGTEVTLRNILRLDKKVRTTVLAKLKLLEKSDDTEGSDSFSQLESTAGEVISLVADHGKKLVAELDGDVALLLTLLNRWMGVTQPGEAEPSPS